MRRTDGLPLMAVLALLAACAAPTPGQPSSSPSTIPHSEPAAPATSEPGEPREPGEPLLEVMRFVPIGSTGVFFTDWSALKSALGAEGITSRAPIEERMAFAQQIGSGSTEAAFSFIGAETFARQGLVEYWGFDNTDLDWEAEIATPRGTAFVLRFRAGFDLATLTPRFDERGFTTESVAEGTLRGHPLDVSEEWVFGAHPALLNVALLSDRRTAVMAVAPESRDAVLDQLGDALDSPLGDEMRATVDALQGPTSAWIGFADDGRCDPASIARPDTAALVAEIVSDAGSLHPYSVIGVGYSSALQPAGRIAFAYDDPADAAADLAGRRRLAADGVTLSQGVPISQLLFTVDEAVTAGSVLILRVAPRDEQAVLLGHMVLTRDLIFAACDT